MRISVPPHTKKRASSTTNGKGRKGRGVQRDELRGTRDERSNASSPLPQKHSEFRESTEFRHDIGFRMPLCEPNDRPEFPKKPRFRHSAKAFRVSAPPFEAEKAPRFRTKRGFRNDVSGHYRPTSHYPNTDHPNRPDCAHRKADGR